MRPYARVRKLTEEEYGELKRWQRSRTMGVSKVRRAKIVLLSHRGLLVQEIAQKLELENGEALYDLAFAVWVGALDGRHPEAGTLARRRVTAALTPDGKLFIDGGNPLREVPLHDVRNA